MAEVVITNGLVLKEQTMNEKDRLVTVLTSELGVIRCYANGAKSIKSKNASSTDMFCYSKLTVAKSKGDLYTIREATPIEVFFDLRRDIVMLALAQYLAELALEFSPRDENAEAVLRLLLNAFYLIGSEKKPRSAIKAATEFRIASLSGYMPNIVACENCGTYETDSMYFNPRSGRLWCENCKTEAEKGSFKVSNGIIAAVRHICLSEPKQVFSFNLTSDSMLGLKNLSERYLHYCTGRTYKTLDFYNEMEVQ